jgi:hypothetical protein
VANKSRPPEVVDSDGLTDADWVEINKLRRAFADGGSRAFWEAMDKLGDADPIRRLRVAGAFFPDVVREALKDEFAAAGMSEEDVREMLRQIRQKSFEDPGTKH